MFKESTISNNLMYSFQSCLDDTFLKSGALFDINDSSSNATGSFSLLKKAKNPNYTDGRMWVARRKNFVWEPEGIQISGVWVNNALVTSGYSINYRDGFVLFDTPVSGTIKLNYSFKFIDVKNSEDVPFLRLDYRSFVLNDAQYTVGSGVVNQKDRIQLPCVCIEPVARSKATPYEIGSRTKRHANEMIVHVLSEDGVMNNKIRDRLQDLEETYVKLFDFENTKIANEYPITRDGFLASNSGTYDYLTRYFPFNKASNKTYTDFFNYVISSSGTYVLDGSGNNVVSHTSGYTSESFINKIVNEGCQELPNSVHHGTLRITFETILSV